MGDVYSTYEAKARFSEILRKVRTGRPVRISYRGEEIAEVRPIARRRPSLKRSLTRLEEAGLIAPAPANRRAPGPIVRRAGALQRFLDSRD
jgi:prevent-host-death family protein